MATRKSKTSITLMLLGVMALTVFFVGIFEASASERLAKDQVLRFALNAADANTFMPSRVSTGQDRVIADLVFSGLVRYTPGNQVDFEPDVATSWDRSEDMKTWTFHLRKGVFFHPFPGSPSGYELTADDVVYSVQRAANPQHSTYSGDYRGMEVEAVDPYTVRVKTEKPLSKLLFLPMFANQRGGFVVCKKAIEEKGEEWAKINPIGTGPFMFKSYEPRQKTVLIQNTRYFRGSPILTEVVIRYMPLISSRELGMQSGELDLFEGQVDSMWVDKMNTIPGQKALTYGPAEIMVIHINTTKPPFSDTRVRKALSYAISRSEMCDLMGEKIATPLYAPTIAPPAIGSLTKEDAMKAGVVYDGEMMKAKELLAESGYPNGFKFQAISSEMTGYKILMVGVQAQLKKVGVDMDLKIVDHPSFHSLIRKDASPFVPLGGWRPNIDAALVSLFISDSIVVTGKRPELNFSHYTGIDELYEKAHYETDVDKQVDLWKEAQIQILKDVAIIPIARKKGVYAIKSYVELGHPATWMWTTNNCQVTERTAILAH